MEIGVMPYDVQKVRFEFPILNRPIKGKALVYLDNGASSQKPLRVIDREARYYEEENANVHRGVHTLSQVATVAYEGARSVVRQFLNARSDKEIIFTKGCTEAINLVAASLRTKGLEAGDTILLSVTEHHSNIVPWQMAAEAVGANVLAIPMSDAGVLDLDAYEQLLSANRVRIVGLTHVSNALGTIHPVKQMVKMAHEGGALVLVDGAQAAPHQLIDVQDLDADFYAVSCHKMYAPTGIGVLYGKQELLEGMAPYQGGGDMIRTVSFEKTTYAGLPNKFEAGTPNMAGAVGLAAAIEWLADFGGRTAEQSLRTGLAAAFSAIGEHEHQLLTYAEGQISDIPGVRITGTAPHKAAVLGFTLDSAHPHDVGTILDAEGIAVRAGHHCCQPLMKRLGVAATVRASFGLYNTKEEVDALVKGVLKVKEIFG